MRKEKLNYIADIKHKNLLVKLTRKSKDSHYKKFFEENKLNALKVWQGIKSLINVKKSNKKTIKSLNVDNKLLTNNNDISIEFNSFFSTIASKIDTGIIQTNTSFQTTLNNPNNKTIFLTPTTPEEIEKTIRYFNSRKANGPNSIPTKLLKSVKKSLAEPLSDLINLVFTTGIFPEILKTAMIIPTF